jgi:hypothetical protein
MGTVSCVDQSAPLLPDSLHGLGKEAGVCRLLVSFVPDARLHYAPE